jgi:hypothetical protein
MTTGYSWSLAGTKLSDFDRYLAGLPRENSRICVGAKVEAWNIDPDNYTNTEDIVLYCLSLPAIIWLVYIFTWN